MNRTQLRILISSFALIIFILIRLNSCQQREIKRHQWTPELEQQMREILDTKTNGMGLDEQARQQYIDCCMAKLKEVFPNGIASMENASDSVKMTIMKMGADCAPPPQKADVWQAPAVEQLKLMFYSYPETKLLPKAVQKEYVECLAFNVTAQFPKGLQGAGKDSLKRFIESSRMECLKLIANKYPKTPKIKVKPDTTTPPAALEK